ncbi:MAG: dialkylresorcinol condensing enzyme DarA, partial [Bacteroidia bacterium]|nr:dialkylresorcinol condensing enzyme DarA [Bacteroidia bacterium]
MKKILVLYYTQSGQLRDILDSIVKPFVEAGDSVTFEPIVPRQQFPFPWSGFTFFNAFPETFSQVPLPLEPTSSHAYDHFDLVILGYQPWFLTPSRPVSSWLQSEAAQAIIGGKKIVTVLGCRNMWLGAQEKLKRHLRRLNGELVGHVALVDRS